MALHRHQTVELTQGNSKYCNVKIIACINYGSKNYYFNDGSPSALYYLKCVICLDLYEKHTLLLKLLMEVFLIYLLLEIFLFDEILDLCLVFVL